MSEAPIDLNPFYWHEALDRTHVITEQLSSAVMEHPVVKQTPELEKLADAAHEALFQLYQAVGRLMPEDGAR